MSIFSDNAEAFATQAPAAIDMERHAAVALAVQLLVEGRPGRAHYELARSVQRQWRIAGLGTWPIGPTSPHPSNVIPLRKGANA